MVRRIGQTEVYGRASDTCGQEIRSGQAREGYALKVDEDVVCVRTIGDLFEHVGVSRSADSRDEGHRTTRRARPVILFNIVDNSGDIRDR